MAPVVLITQNEALPANRRVWGTGGWLPPEEREALDWLTLCRLLGWAVQIHRVSLSGHLDSELQPDARVVVIACDPACINDDVVDSLESLLDRHPLLVVTPAPMTSSRLARLTGAVTADSAAQAQSIEWCGPGVHWSAGLKQAVGVRGLSCAADVRVWATMAGKPAVVSRPHGPSAIATLAVLPGALRDAHPAGTRAMKTLLTHGTPGSIAWLDLEHTVVLRMDDPGGAQNVHSDNWCYGKLDVEAWADVADDLGRRNARISLGYIPAWVDDGDPRRGQLIVDGRAGVRVPGAVHPSPTVKYHDLEGHRPGTTSDYEAEFSGIQMLRQAGCGDVEAHGFTHMHPDRDAWLRAPDRFQGPPGTSWFREFGRAAAPVLAQLAPGTHPLDRSLQLFRDYFDVTPTTLICPGDEFTDAVIERALDLGFELVSSYYLAIRDEGRFCWTTHVCAPYLDRPDPSWFSSELPVVGYFHDYELATQGVAWMKTLLDDWEAAGARRFIDFRELAAALSCRLTLQARADDPTLVIHRQEQTGWVRSIPIRLRTDGGLPHHLNVHIGAHQIAVPVLAQDDGTGRVLLPPGALSFHD